VECLQVAEAETRGAAGGSGMRIRIDLFLILISGMLVCLLGAPAEEPERTWDYSAAHGPTHWADLKPEFAACRTGHSQSPIDIRHTRKADLPPIQFNYNVSLLHIIDNGHTVMVNYDPGSNFSVGGKTCQLKQFHFRHPSEEKIQGKNYEMVAHLVHADQEGNLAVVAVLLQKGEENQLIHKLWDHLPHEAGKAQTLENVQIEANGLLPADHSYYTFPGSLTTPPCTENVAWYVLKHPVTISAAEIEQFGKV
jgi:carbonic anhydrase